MAISLGRRVFGLALAASLCATGALAIGILLLSDFDDTSARILATTALISLYSLISLPGGLLLDRRRAVPLAWATLGFAAAGFVLAVYEVWIDDFDHEVVWKLLVTVTAFAGACSQESVSIGRRRRADSPSVRRLFAVSTGSGYLLAALVAVAAWGEVDDETYYRFLGALAVANVLLVLLQPILRRVGTAGAGPAESPFRFSCTLADGSSVTRSQRGADFASALAHAVHDLEQRGARVTRIERLEDV
jgi:hypothetical protein